jgi:hypothetical protein
MKATEDRCFAETGKVALSTTGGNGNIVQCKYFFPLTLFTFFILTLSAVTGCIDPTTTDALNPQDHGGQYDSAVRTELLSVTASSIEGNV